VSPWLLTFLLKFKTSLDGILGVGPDKNLEFAGFRSPAAMPQQLSKTEKDFLPHGLEELKRETPMLGSG